MMPCAARQAQARWTELVHVPPLLAADEFVMSCKQTHADVDSIVYTAQVKFNKDCHKKMKHVACSYKDYSKGDSSMHHW